MEHPSLQHRIGPGKKNDRLVLWSVRAGQQPRKPKKLGNVPFVHGTSRNGKTLELAFRLVNIDSGNMSALLYGVPREVVQPGGVEAGAGSSRYLGTKSRISIAIRPEGKIGHTSHARDARCL